MQQTGNMLEQHAVQRQQLANETNVSDVYSNRFSPAFRNLRENFLKLEGKDAEAQFPAYEQQAMELRNQYREALPNDIQRKLFDRDATRRVQLELDGMARYAAEQTKKYEWNTYQSAVADLASEAEANYNNPPHLEDVQARLDTKVIDYGSSHGWSPEIYQAQRKAATDRLWESVITRQAIDAPEGAFKPISGKMRQVGFQVMRRGKLRNICGLFRKPSRRNAHMGWRPEAPWQAGLLPRRRHKGWTQARP